ncbi:MAG: hypothetical protein V1780_06485, partial [Chloroflexota bacterium]
MLDPKWGGLNLSKSDVTLDPPRKKPLFKGWSEYPIRKLEVVHLDKSVTDYESIFGPSYDTPTGEKRGVRTAQIGLNLYHMWRAEVTKRFGPEVARDIALNVGKRWGILTADVIGGPPDFADVYSSDKQKAFRDAWIACLRSSYLMHETYEITEINPNLIIWRTLCCRQHLPWRDGVFELPPDPDLCMAQCDQWWDWTFKGRAPGKAKMDFIRSKTMHEDGYCEWICFVTDDKGKPLSDVRDPKYVKAKAKQW